MPPANRFRLRIYFDREIGYDFALGKVLGHRFSGWGGFSLFSFAFGKYLFNQTSVIKISIFNPWLSWGFLFAEGKIRVYPPHPFYLRPNTLPKAKS